MAQDFQILKRIYNVFDPFRPLPAGDPAYVDCREVRGDGDILVEVGQEILYSERMTCQARFCKIEMIEVRLLKCQKSLILSKQF